VAETPLAGWLYPHPPPRNHQRLSGDTEALTRRVLLRGRRDRPGANVQRLLPCGSSRPASSRSSDARTLSAARPSSSAAGARPRSGQRRRVGQFCHLQHLGRDARVPPASRPRPPIMSSAVRNRWSPTTSVVLRGPARVAEPLRHRLGQMLDGYLTESRGHRESSPW
jgi:hypothetical protein